MSETTVKSLITPLDQTLRQVFNTQKSYFIDIYQREYKWTKEQVETLLNDVGDRFAQHKRPKTQPKDIQEDVFSNYDPYFLNTYLTSKSAANTAIVDGQQRLTTLLLILIKLYHVLKTIEQDPANHGKTFSSKVVEQLIFETDDFGAAGRFKIFNENRESAFKALVEGVQVKKADQSCTRMAENFQIISAYFENFLAESPQGPIDLVKTTYYLTYHISTKTEDSGGRIDIVIEDVMRRRILIENKIYAGDQENQLTRYRNFDRSARLYYLTLFGVNPTNLTSDQVRGHRCECISYKEHIRDWLHACRKEAACLPAIREMLSQYIALIEELTHQSTTKEMNKELIEEILKIPENLSAFYAIRDADLAVHSELISRLDKDLAEFAESIGLKKNGSLQEANTNEGTLTFESKDLTQSNLVIAFQFGSRGYNNMYFGFCKIDPDKPCLLAERLFDAFNVKFTSEIPTNWWAAWMYLENPYRYWGREAYEGIRSGQLAGNLKAKIEILSRIAMEACGNASIQIANSTSPIS